MDIVSTTIRLYQQALLEAGRSFLKCWIIAVAVVVFAVLLLIIMTIAGSLGFLGGFLVGFANAFMVVWTLSLVEQAVQGARRLGWQDVWGSAGHYFGDVITLGFILSQREGQGGGNSLNSLLVLRFFRCIGTNEIKKSLSRGYIIKFVQKCSPYSEQNPSRSFRYLLQRPSSFH